MDTDSFGLPEGAELLFRDDFERSKIGRGWIIKQGSWAIREGAMYGEGAGAQIMLSMPVGEDNIRLEYDAWSTEDAPGKLSARILASLSDTGAGYVFQFGGFQDDRTELRKGDTLIGGADKFIERGRKHRVICEKRGPFLRFVIDGKVVYSGFDISPSEVYDPADTCDRDKLSFFIYSSGYIDNIRVYRLPGEPPAELLSGAPQEPGAASWFGFNDTGKELPRGVRALERGGGTVNVRDFPDFVLSGRPPQEPRMISDGCVEMSSDAGGEAGVSVDFPALVNGMVELELLFLADEHYGPGGFKLSLHREGSDKAAVTLETDEAGHFTSPQAEGENALPVIQQHPRHREYSAPLIFQANRWHRIRIHFDADEGKWTIALVGVHYSDARWGSFPHVTADWMVLGDGLSLAEGTGRIVRLEIGSVLPGKLLLDNVYIIGPWNGRTVNEKDYRNPARVLLGTDEHPRHDPPRLRIYSTRSIQEHEMMTTYMMHSTAREQFDAAYPVIAEAARLHGEILVKLAFLEERGRRALRASQYLESSARKAEAEALAATARKLEEDFGRVHIMYAEAYLDGRDQDRMKTGFIPAAEELLDRAGRAESEFDRWFADIRADELKLETKPEMSLPRPEYSPEDASYMRAGRPAFYFTHYGRPIWRWQHELLGLDECVFLAHPWSRGRDDGEWTNPEYFAPGGSADRYWFGTYPEGRICFGFDYGQHFIGSSPPLWWLEKHGDDPDIFFHDEEGNPNLHDHGSGRKLPWNRQGHAQLNYWNPKARDMFRKQIESTLKTLERQRPGRTSLIEIMPESHHTLRNFGTGYNQSATAAFREKMKQKYETICELNSTWGASYGGFGDITPPPDIVRAPRSRPGPLNYEWELFRQEGYRDWMKLITDEIRKHMPGVPITTRRMGDTHVGGGEGVRNGFLLPMFYPLVDFFEFHFDSIQANRISSRVIESLRRALGGAGGSMGESYIGCTGETFCQTWAGRTGSLYIFDLAAANRSRIDYWGAGGGYGWTQTSGWTDPRFGHTIITYAAARQHSVVTSRLRALERFLLDAAPAVPEVNLFNAESSFLQGALTHWEMQIIANFLETERLDYGFLWESLVLDGKQDLEGSDVIIIGRGRCLSVKAQEKLLQWMRGGGMLISVAGAPGIYDEFGREAGTLLRGIEKENLTGNYIALADARTQENRDKLLSAVESASSRFVRSDGGKFWFTIRKDDRQGEWRLTVSNPDMLESHEDKIRVKVPGAKVRDAELPGLKIPVESCGDHTSFRLRLEPCEIVALAVAR